MKISNFFLLLKYIFFSIYYCPSEATEDTCMFPEDKLSTIYLDLQIQKVFSLPALNASCVLLEHQWMFEPFLIVCLSPSMVLSVKRWMSKSYSHCWKGFKYANMLENCRIYRTWRICLKNSAQFNCSEQTRTHEQPTQTKEQSWIIQVTSHSIKNQGFPNFWRGYLNNFSYFFVLWTICKHIYVKYLTQDSTNKK